MGYDNPGQCNACPLCEGRTQVVLPDGPRFSLLAVGEAPGREEDTTGVGFTGAAGRTLDRVLAEHGIARSGYARTNVVRCRPPGNRRPRRPETQACSHWLLHTVRDFAPAVVLTVGHTATRHLLPSWKDNHLERVRALLAQAPARSELPLYAGVPVVPMPHTSGLSWNQKLPDNTPVNRMGRAAVTLAASIAAGFDNN